MASSLIRYNFNDILYISNVYDPLSFKKKQEKYEISSDPWSWIMPLCIIIWFLIFICKFDWWSFLTVRCYFHNSLFGSDASRIAEHRLCKLNKAACEKYMEHSRPFRPGCDPRFFFHSSMLWMTTKNDKTIFRFFENSSGSEGRDHRGMRAVVDYFKIYIMNSLIKIKKFQMNFIIIS